MRRSGWIIRSIRPRGACTTRSSLPTRWLARKAFYGHVPFPLVHIDTHHKIPEMIEYRDRLAMEYGLYMVYGENREALEGLYRKLPTSVFQADLNSTNLLVDEDGNFKGVCDFNLCGKEVFLNYLMRENFDDFEKEIGLIREVLRIASETYDFNEDEKKAALPLYRCLKPLWYTRVCDLQEAGNDPEKVRECLDRIEHYQTADIDFAGWMGGPGN